MIKVKDLPIIVLSYAIKKYHNNNHQQIFMIHLLILYEHLNFQYFYRVLKH